MAGIIKDIKWTPDNSKICIAGDGKNVFGKVFLADSGNLVGEISGFSKPCSSCDFKKIKPFDLALASEDFNVGFFSGPPYKFKHSQKLHSSFINCVRYDPTGNFLLSASSDNSLGIFDI